MLRGHDGDADATSDGEAELHAERATESAARAEETPRSEEVLTTFRGLWALIMGRFLGVWAGSGEVPREVAPETLRVRKVKESVGIPLDAAKRKTSVKVDSQTIDLAR